MKGEKGDGKIIEPMFPRLHVNDREQGGPRAPPRNKMALYEQLSIPSSCKLNSAGSSVQIPPPKGTTLLRSTSLTQGNQQRTVFAPSDLPPQTCGHSAERINSQSLDCANLNSARLEFGRPSKRQATENAWNANRSAGRSHQQLDSATAEKSLEKNFEAEDDFRVPNFVSSRISVLSSRNLSATDSKKLSTVCAASLQKSASTLSPNSSGNIRNGKCSKDLMKNNEQIPVEAAVVKDFKRVPDAERFTDLPSSANKTSNKDNTDSVSILKTSSYRDANLHSENRSNDALYGARCSSGVGAVLIADNSRVRQGSFSEASSRNNQIASGGAQGINIETESNSNRLPVLEDMYRNEDSESSTPESISGVVISPDDVVGVIGPKHFWKARRAIVDQQRIFAIQVFELHRLIKVQKLLASSPDVIKVDVYITHSPEKQILEEDPQPENIEKSRQPIIFEQEASSEKPNKTTECEEANTTQDPPVCETPSEPVQALSDPGSSPHPWCFHPQLNQWLFPVVSHSEGLIYKPYTGPCPPPAGFMPPSFANCLNFPQAPADFMNPFSGAVHPYHQQPPLYFPSPYALPVMNTDIVSASVAFEQSKGSSCNVSNPRSEVISLHFRKSEASKGSEVQEGNFASQFTKDSAALFTPFRDSVCSKRSLGTSGRGARNQVIRVVPRNASLATESAARIFLSIQEERKQYAS